MSRGLRNASITSVGQSNTSVELLAAGERAGFTIYNDSADDADLYVALGSADASTSAFTVKLAVGIYYEGPWGYDGPVQGIWSASGAGAARVTEVQD